MRRIYFEVCLSFYWSTSLELFHAIAIAFMITARISDLDDDLRFEFEHQVKCIYYICSFLIGIYLGFLSFCILWLLSF